MKVTTKATQNPFLNYPKIDEHRKHYLHWPVQNKKGKWVAANILEDGYMKVDGDHTKVQFQTEEHCQRACDIHNSWCGWSKKQAMAMVAYSMNNSK